MIETTNPTVTDRRGYLGGTDAAAICGASKWKDRAEVYAETLGLPTKPRGETGMMQWGKRHEAAIAEAYAEATGRRVFRATSKRHKKHNYLLAHTDRRVKNDKDGTRRGLEIKSAYPRTREQWDAWGESGTDRVPLDTMFQVSHYLGVTGFDVFDVAVLLNGNDFRIYTIQRDDVLIDEVIEREVKFWRDHIVPRVPPEIENADTAALLFPKANGVYIEAPAGLIPALVEFEMLAERRKADDARHKDLRGVFLKILKDSQGFQVGNEILLHARSQSRTGYDTKRLVAEFAGVADTLRTTSNSRVITRTEALSRLQVEEEETDA